MPAGRSSPAAAARAATASRPELTAVAEPTESSCCRPPRGCVAALSSPRPPAAGVVLGGVRSWCTWRCRRRRPETRHTSRVRHPSTVWPRPIPRYGSGARHRPTAHRALSTPGHRRRRTRSSLRSIRSVPELPTRRPSPQPPRWRPDHHRPGSASRSPGRSATLWYATGSADACDTWLQNGSADCPPARQWWYGHFPPPRTVTSTNSAGIWTPPWMRPAHRAGRGPTDPPERGPDSRAMAPVSTAAGIERNRNEHA